MTTNATFSDDRRYRYTLWRLWDNRPYCMFIGLNPSTADEKLDDPTIRRCTRFAKDWGFGGLCMTNLFAFRATDPKDMMAVEDPIGQSNDETLFTVSQSTQCGLRVAAWGVHGAYKNRGIRVHNQYGKNLYHLGLTKDGFPKHPLYLKASTKPVSWDLHFKA